MFSLKKSTTISRLWHFGLTILLGFGLTVVMFDWVQAQDINPYVPNAVNATTYHVAKSGDGSDGLSWATAFTDLQDALAIAADGDEIWVASGVYTPGLSQSDSFALASGVRLYGGFAGTESSLGQRDWEANTTVLSGDIGGDDTTDANGVVTATANISGSNSYHVVWADGVTAPITESTVLDGFTITAGQATDSSYPHSSGGGMYCNGADPGNRCSPSLSHLHFIANIATGAGGAMFNDGYRGDSSPSLTHVSFAGNAAEWGGGMSNFGGDNGNSDPTLVNVTFSGNRATFGGAMDNYADFYGYSSPSLVNVTFANNVATVNGGAIHNDSGGTSVISGRSSPSLNNVILWGNTAITGSQIYNNGATPLLSYTLIQSDSNAIVNDDGGSVIYGPNSLTGNPLFANALGTDGISGTLDDDLRLGSFSPAIDAGTNAVITTTTDLGGNPRFVDDEVATDTGNGTPPIVAMGAYERQSNSCANESGIIHVNQAVLGGANNGTDWANAYTDLQSALSQAYTCAPIEIWVATGVYTPGLSQSDSFSLTAEIQLYGGFAATETLRSERDWAVNPTILSGDIDGNDITDAKGVVTSTTHISGSNSYHVVWVQGTSDKPVTTSTVLDGFTITAGSEASSGGGLYCDGYGSGNNCSPALSNLTFAGNMADEGGAIYNKGGNGGASSPSLNNVTFSNNAAISGDGGAMYNNAGSDGITSPILWQVSFSGNMADSYGGAIYNYANTNSTSSPVFTDVTFFNNIADEGGAVNNHGSDGVVNPTFSEVIFYANRASSGGAVYNWGRGGEASPIFYNVSFLGNVAESSSAGALEQVSSIGGISSPQLTNVLFTGNIAASQGGGLYNYSLDTNSESNPSLVNVTMVNNSAQEGGAIYSRNNGGTAIPSLSNVILWANTATSAGSQIFDNNTTTVISYSLVQGGDSGSNTGTAFSDGTGNIDADPLFVNALGTDSITGTLDDDLRLLATSPAIDTGDNATCAATDILGIPRPQGTTCDMGAYEHEYFSLSIIMDGTGSGSVTADPQQSRYDYGTVVTLTATVDTGSTFTGWSGGGCSGTETCVVTMDEDKSVAATFTLNQYELSVSLDGNGMGSVSSNPAGIDCGTDCAEGFDYGTDVTLTATVDTGSIFTGWSGGGCSGMGTCVVTIEEATAVMATFDKNTYFIYLPMIVSRQR